MFHLDHLRAVCITYFDWTDVWTVKKEKDGERQTATKEIRATLLLSFGVWEQRKDFFVLKDNIRLGLWIWNVKDTFFARNEHHRIQQENPRNRISKHYARTHPNQQEFFSDHLYLLWITHPRVSATGTVEIDGRLKERATKGDADIVVVVVYFLWTALRFLCHDVCLSTVSSIDSLSVDCVFTYNRLSVDQSFFPSVCHTFFTIISTILKIVLELIMDCDAPTRKTKLNFHKSFVACTTTWRHQIGPHRWPHGQPR